MSIQNLDMHGYFHLQRGFISFSSFLSCFFVCFCYPRLHGLNCVLLLTFCFTALFQVCDRLPVAIDRRSVIGMGPAMIANRTPGRSVRLSLFPFLFFHFCRDETLIT